MPPADRSRPLAPTEVDHAGLFRLDGDAVVVVGAGGGVGEHVARTVAAMGARVLCVDVDAAGLAGVAGSLRAPSLVADATTEDGVAAITEAAVAELGTVNGYVDVIGQLQRKPLPAFSMAEWEQDLRVNLTHAFLLGRRLAPVVAESGRGSIVHVSSVMGRHAGRLSPGYGPAKAALEVLVKSMAAEYGPAGVRVNAVAPGLFLSPRFTATGADADGFLSGRTMLGRLGQPYEVAATVAFLLTPAAGYMTASTLLVEGGATAVDSTGLDLLPYSP